MPKKPSNREEVHDLLNMEIRPAFNAHVNYDILQPSTLTKPLYNYQKQTVLWMLNRESVDIIRGKFKFAENKFTDVDCYRMQDEPESQLWTDRMNLLAQTVLRGGLLAEEVL
jgi:hypothetical protein